MKSSTLVQKILSSFNQQDNLAMAFDGFASSLCDYLGTQRLFLIETQIVEGQEFVLRPLYEFDKEVDKFYEADLRLDYDTFYPLYAKTFAIDNGYYFNQETIEKLPDFLKQSYKAKSVKSSAAHSIYKNGELWGLIGFHDVETNREDFEEISFFLDIMVNLIEMKIRQSESINVERVEADDNEQKMMAIGKMAAGIAHEINNPMFVIYGYASKIESLVDEKNLDEELLRHYSQMISKNVRRINGIISGLQSISRNESRDAFEVSSVNNIIEKTLDFSRERIRHGEIDLHLDLIDEDLPVECRPGQLVQVLTNLLNNSYDAIENSEGDKWIRIKSFREGERCYVTVTDSGKSLPKDVQEKIMQPFFSSKAKGKGTGLGLSISNEIVKKHDGTLKIDSASENMCFVLDLPLLHFE